MENDKDVIIRGCNSDWHDLTEEDKERIIDIFLNNGFDVDIDDPDFDELVKIWCITLRETLSLSSQNDDNLGHDHEYDFNNEANRDNKKKSQKRRKLSDDDNNSSEPPKDCVFEDEYEFKWNDDKCERDPITLDEIDQDKLIKVRCNGRLYCFDIDSFKENLNAGNKNNPYTNEAFSDEFIESFYDKYNLKYPQQYESKNLGENLKQLDELFKEAQTTLTYHPTLEERYRGEITFYNDIAKNTLRQYKDIDFDDFINTPQPWLDYGTLKEYIDKLTHRILNRAFQQDQIGGTRKMRKTQKTKKHHKNTKFLCRECRKK